MCVCLRVFVRVWWWWIISFCSLSVRSLDSPVMERGGWINTPKNLIPTYRLNGTKMSVKERTLRVITLSNQTKSIDVRTDGFWCSVTSSLRQRSLRCCRIGVTNFSPRPRRGHEDFR